MKVIDIIEQYDTVRKEKQRNTAFNYDYLNRLGTSKGADSKGRGQGWYSRGVPHPTDPHTFIKSTKLTSKLRDDAFHKYIEMVVSLRRKGIENSYFPTVYEIKITKDPNDSTRPSYHLQALNQYRDYEPEVLAGLAGRLFKNFEQHQEKDSDLRKHSYSIWSYICNECRSAVEYGEYGNIQDEELAAALRYIRALQKKNRYDVDMHSGNFLLRGSSTGPQLVISDPVSDGGRSIPTSSEVNQGPEGTNVGLQAKAQQKLKQRQQPRAREKKFIVAYRVDRGWRPLLTDQGTVMTIPAVSDDHAQHKWEQMYFRDQYKAPRDWPYDYYMTLIMPMDRAEERLGSNWDQTDTPMQKEPRQQQRPAQPTADAKTKSHSWFDDLDN